MEKETTAIPADNALWFICYGTQYRRQVSEANIALRKKQNSEFKFSYDSVTEDQQEYRTHQPYTTVFNQYL